MKYSLRSLAFLTAGGILGGWGLAALACSFLFSQGISFPASSAKGIVRDAPRLVRVGVSPFPSARRPRVGKR